VAVGVGVQAAAVAVDIQIHAFIVAVFWVLCVSRAITIVCVISGDGVNVGDAVGVMEAVGMSVGLRKTATWVPA
jgi:hypothetical protein